MNAGQQKLRFFTGTAILLMPLLLLFGLNQLKRAEYRKLAKRAIEQNLPEHLVTTFLFTESEYQHLEWEHEKEFELNGNMYDVIDTTHTPQGIVVRCFEDTEESAFKQELNALTASLLGVADPVLPNAQKQLLNTWCKGFPKVTQTTIKAWTSSNELCFKTEQEFQQMQKSKPPTPPPNVEIV